ncbi:WG repeat-containing protein [Chitinophaga sp.]|uniref:WG repeat-containing protein n=1 Tax=Chitinophaga sp. TaxID=1869181 RepID=UPI002BC37C68|nr:WG repeat-containing protein [Chitinophaga sp.]HWV69492.1 WG repeat-containing protein [Chitinophaga sp.]
MMINSITAKHIRYLLAGVLLLAARTLPAQQASVFSNGFARIVEAEKSWYIDPSGKKVFDQVLAAYHPVTTTPLEENGHSLIVPDKQTTMLLVTSNGKTGIVNNNGKWVLPAEYDAIEMKWKTYLVLRRDGKMTYADTYGKLLLPMQFEDAGILDNENFDVKTGGKWGIYSTAENKLLIPAMYESFDYCGGCGSKGDYLFAQKDGKWGIIDFNNKVLIPFAYEHEHFFMRSDNWVTSLKKNGQDVTISLGDKKEYAAPEYTDMTITNNGSLRARKNGKYGLIGEDGTQIADFIYDDISDAYDEQGYGPYLRISQNGKTGILRKDGKVIIPPVYEGDVVAAGEYFIIPVDGNYNITDSTGKKLLPKNYTDITLMDKRFSTLLFKLKQKALYGFYNAATRKVVEPAFFDIDHTTATAPGMDLLEVSYQEMYGLYSTSGQQVLPVEYKKAEGLAPGLVAVKKETGVGVYDIMHKKMLIPAIYSSVDISAADASLLIASRKEDYASVFFNFKGMKVPAPKERIPPPVAKSRLVEKKVAGSEYPLYGYANNTGKIIIAPVYDRLLVEKNGRGFLAQTGSKFTVLDAAGKPVSKQAFDDVVLEEAAGYGVTEVQYGFPLLCRTGDIFQYLTANGTFLPLKITGVAPFDRYPEIE